MKIVAFGSLPSGEQINSYTLKNKSGAVLEVIPYGCRVISLIMPDKNGNLGDVVLGHRTLAEYLGSNYQGSFVGRYANRIGNAEFMLDGAKFCLDKNDGENSLHGGSLGYHQVLFDVAESSGGENPSITFAHTSPHMDEGYPGELKIKVKYTLTESNEFEIEYEARADRETVFNPTNHSFFNLSGDFSADILNTQLQINAKRVTAISDDLIPTGELLPVQNTPLDFTAAKKLGVDMFSDEHSIKMNSGFDHNFCVDGTGFRKHAEAYEPESGRVMEVFSDMPGVQLYTFNITSGLVNKDGSDMRPHSAFCLETQFYPDSPNKPNFPFETLKAGEIFKSKAVYKFSVK